RTAVHVRQTSLCTRQVPTSRDHRVQLRLHIRTRPARAPHHERARRLRVVEVLHEALAGPRNPVLHRRARRLQATALLRPVRLPRATARQLHLRLQLLKGARTSSHHETENAALRGGVSFFCSPTMGHSFCFTRTTVIFPNPSSKVGGRSFAA